MGMLIAPSAAGCALVWTAFTVFFLRRPLKLVLSRKPDPRTTLASVIVVALSTIALTGLFLAVALGNIKDLWPLIPAAIAGIGFAWFDSHNEGREGAAELCGATAFSVLPATFAKLAGWSITESAALASVMLVRSVPTVLFVRTCLRHNKGQAASPAPAFIASLLGLTLTVWLAYARLAPWPAAILAAFLTAMTFWVLAGRRRFTAKRIGLVELTFGVVMVLTLAMTWKSH